MSASNRRRARKSKGKGRMMSSITASSVPAARSYRVQQKPPRIIQGLRDTIIEGHELVETVYGSAAFVSRRIRINPGLNSTFKWLSERAKGWDMYYFEELTAVYIPSKAVTTTPGSIYLVADYDPSDKEPDSLADLSTFQSLSDGRVYEKISLRLDPKEMHRVNKGKKIRCGPVAGDLSLYDPGSITVGKVDCDDASAVGQLWLFYRVKLFSPQTGPPIQTPTMFNQYKLNLTETVVTGVAERVPFDGVTIEGMDELNNDNGEFSLPCGGYIVTAELSAESTTADSPLWLSFAWSTDGAIPPATAQYSKTSTWNRFLHGTLTTYIYSDGTKKLQLWATVTGSGNLTLTKDGCRVSFQCVTGG